MLGSLEYIYLTLLHVRSKCHPVASYLAQIIINTYYYYLIISRVNRVDNYINEIIYYRHLCCYSAPNLGNLQPDDILRPRAQQAEPQCTYPPA